MKKLVFCLGLLLAGVNFSFAQCALTASNKEIKRGNDVVATYTRTESREGDKVTMEMKFIGNSGAVVATATIPYQQKGETTSILTNDGKKHTIVLKSRMDVDMAQEIAQLLAENKYL